MSDSTSGTSAGVATVVRPGNPAATRAAGVMARECIEEFCEEEEEEEEEVAAAIADEGKGKEDERVSVESTCKGLSEERAVIVPLDKEEEEEEEEEKETEEEAGREE